MKKTTAYQSTSGRLFVRSADAAADSILNLVAKDEDRGGALLTSMGVHWMVKHRKQLIEILQAIDEE